MFDGRVFLGEDFSQPVEAAFHLAATLGDPVGERGEPLRLDAAGAHAPDLLAADQPARLEYLQMLDHRGKGHVERLRERADGRRPAAQPLDDGPARRLHEGPQAAVDDV